MESRSRAANWTAAEIAEVVDGYCDEKTRSIEEICTRVNAVGGNERTTEDVKDKWTYMKSETRKKERSRRRYAAGTGAGPAPKALRPWEEKILQFLPNVLLDGLAEGTDSFKDASTSKVQPIIPDVNGVVPEAGECSTRSSSKSSISDAVQQTDKRKIKKSQVKCDCDERVIEIENKKLEEKKKIRQTLESIDVTLRSILELKKRKLDLMEGNELLERSNLFDSLV